MPSFHDEFSRQAAAYTQFRPSYPTALFEFLSASAPGHDAAWDAATGNGQCARSLAKYFAFVAATDASAEQIGHAKPHARVRYAIATAEACGFADASFDAVTVAQAAHWFDFSRFIPEVKRVLRPQGVIAFWGYAFHHSDDPVLESLLREIGMEILGPYWSPQPKSIWNGYADLAFPFRRIETPSFELTVSWTLPELIGYFSTWSATQKFIAANGFHPACAVYDRLARAWGAPDTKRTLTCPLVVKVGLRD